MFKHFPSKSYTRRIGVSFEGELSNGMGESLPPKHTFAIADSFEVSQEDTRRQHQTMLGKIRA